MATSDLSHTNNSKKKNTNRFKRIGEYNIQNLYNFIEFKG